jgi:Fe-S-cluster containining protein
LFEYTDPRWPGTKSFLLKHVDGACIFLKADPSCKQFLCKIHGFKPACCLEWESGLNKQECLKGLLAIWHLTVDASGNLQGTPQDIQLFQEYKLSLENLS